jgi:UDP-N-acetylglucosamine--dolichyl-phosphate N-acetylglucosaminephosphotransferase
MPFPKVKDYHKLGQPLVPTCYGVFFSLVSVCYWFILSFLKIYSVEALALATSVLFGSTMGLIDDMADLRWRYKAILPLFASLPYIAFGLPSRTSITLPLVGLVNLNILFFYLLVPVIVTVTTNTYNQLGGLNGLESLTGLIVLIGLAVASENWILMIVPILCLSWLAYLSFTGKAFIGNVGTFSIGLTLAVYAVLMNLKLVLLISLTPFVLNSILILFSNYILREKADTLISEDGHLYSHRIRSLRTLILHNNPMSEHRVVSVICLLIALSTSCALVLHMLS